MQKKSLYVMLTLAWSVALYVVFSGFTYRADFKMGYVMSDKIFSEYQPAVDATKEIEIEQQKLEKQALTMQSEFEEKYQDYESKKLMWSDKKKAETEMELDDLRTEYLQFTQENLNPDTGKLAQMWMEKIGPIIEDVQKVIDRIGVEEGYDIIFDVKEELPLILYANEEYDITDHILEELKKK